MSKKRPRWALATVAAALLLSAGLSGCGDAQKYARRFPVGGDFTDSEGRVLGRVVGFDAEHDFANGVGGQAAVEVELSTPVEGLPTHGWYACQALKGGPGNYEVRPHREGKP
ncbi:MAG: hypothetical protein JO295_11655 [Verrucomicrobia bacterium]|nr:hypothetical protein [Verrucomicrobiota bacterium]